MPNLTWRDFERNTSDIKKDFEDMARVFFKTKFFDSNTIFSQSPNNAGVEITPVKYGKNFISFQAKHFDNSVSYDKIKNSILKAIQYYDNTQLNVIYLICNKDLDQKCKTFLEIKQIVTNAGMSLKLICNNAILDEISTNDIFENIRCCFFGDLRLNKKWFEDRLSIALDDLSGRYDKELNVDIPLQRHFEFIFESGKMVDIAKEFLDSFKLDCKKLDKIDKTIKNQIVNLADSLSIPSKDNIRNVFGWKNSFKDIKKTIEDEAKKAKEKWANDTTNDKNLDEYYAYSEAVDIIDSLDSVKISHTNEYPFSVIEKRIVFLTGHAGTGKSHLIGFEADTHKDENRIILLLGQKLINNNNPWTQIKGCLDITCDMRSFLNALECKGAIDNSVITIMIDAINESACHKIWKLYLNELVLRISELKHVKLICSIRTSYIEAIFDDSIKEKINKKEILVLEHKGFSFDTTNAIGIFFEKHGIPAYAANYLPMEFSNPLLLKLFCQTYDISFSVEKLSYMCMFAKLVKIENEKIKQELNINDKMDYVQQVVDFLTTKMIENKTALVLRKHLMDLSDRQEQVLGKMLVGQIVSSFYSEDEHDEIIYFRYELMGDYHIAENFIKKYDLQQLYSFIKTSLYAGVLDMEINNGSDFITAGIIAAVFSLLDVKYKSEFADFILSLDDTKCRNVEEIILETIRCFSFMRSDMIKERQYFNIVDKAVEKYQDMRFIEEHYNVLINNSYKPNNEINSNFLTKRLKAMVLTHRDFSWTIYINYEYREDSSKIRHIIKSIIDNNVYAQNKEERFLLSQLLCWFLTSSNRVLRDKASRSIVKILTNEFELLNRLYDIFSDVNDPYVVQRFFGCMYGAILKSDVDKTNAEHYITIINKIYKDIFNKEEVYPDILLRDYARNIIEYAQHIRIELPFDINICRPPYKSQPIPTVDIERVENEYKYDNEGNERSLSAFYTIKHSMMPDIYVNGLKMYYGDFGRYTFQSALWQFENIDIYNAYYYALDYIKNTLGFSEIFATEEIEQSKYCYRSYSRWEHNVERISKKYQWITAYRIWALVSDHHEYNKRDSDGLEKYSGPWEPYVRDFDPTLTISKHGKVYDINDIIFDVPMNFSEWEFDNENWIERTDNIFDYEKFLEIRDRQNEEWICLFFKQSSKSTDNYNVDHRLLLREAMGFFVKQSDYQRYINFLKDKFYSNSWGEYMNGNYEIFADEYIWSPAFKDKYTNNFRPYEIETGKSVIKRVKNVIPKIIFKCIDSNEEFDLMNSDNMTSEYIDQEHKITKKIMAKCAWYEYFWEEEYDYSKEETIRYKMPCADIINHFDLKQKNNGIWYLKDEIVCLDLSLVKNTDSKSLYIKKSILTQFLREKKYNLFWIGSGLKQDIKTDGFIYKPESKYAKMSIFIYMDKNWKLIKSGELLHRD